LRQSQRKLRKSSTFAIQKFHENPLSRSRERLSGIFVTDGKTKKNICKTYTHPPHRRLRKRVARSVDATSNVDNLMSQHMDILGFPWLLILFP